MFGADMRRDERFIKVKVTITDLSAMLVEAKKNLSHGMVYKLLKLVLMLLVGPLV
jgi:hypothetical protein